MEHPPTPAAPDATASPTPPRPAEERFPIVGLGASAGGLEALEGFLDHTPPDTGMAFVVILHLAPEHDSHAASVLQAHTAMPVTQVTDRVPLAPNHVYVIPPAQHLALVDGHLQLRAPQTEQDRRAPVDHFFRTLADTHGSQAAAVILSGTGSDGAIGLKRVKEHGGTILVQDPQEASFDGMPRSAIATGLVDYVLPVAAMPELLSAFWHRAAQLRLPAGDGDGGATDEATLREILALLRVRTNHDFSRYKRPTLFRRIGRRMQVTGVPDQPTYLEVLRTRPEEVQALLQDLLISVTNFFRDREAWTALEAIIPLVFAGKGPDDQVRVWVTACATGEEAYSVAMLLDEHAQTLDAPPAIQVFATDIDAAAIRQARQGRYPETIAGDVSPERLKQFFVWEQGRYRVKQELRERVLFAHHNVLHDPPFSQLDLITCRNLLIYLNREAQEQVVRLFHFSLRPGGYLLLGAAESLDGLPQLFDMVAKGQRLFRQRAERALPPPPLVGRGTLPLPGAGVAPGPQRAATPAGTTPSGALGELHQRLLLAEAPASVIVTADYDILHLSRGVSRYLEQEGEPSVNLLRVVHPDLRLPLRTLLVQAAQTGSRTERPHLRVAVDDTARLIDLAVAPIQDAEAPSGALLVLFSDAGAAGADAGSAPADAGVVVGELEAELEHTRQQLQLTVEAYETAGEEYKAANEELQAINEELRAASEELETSREELQAVNQELSTVNQELKTRVDEVSQANNDLQNLIAATDIATLFLDRELRLMRYTPSAEGIFNLLPTDLHRPLAHITHTLRDERIAADAAQVVRSLTPIEREVASAEGRWYLLRLRPYRTTDDRIAGVVLTLVDISARKQAEDALRASEERLRLLIESATDYAIFTLDPQRRVTSWNTGAEAMFGYAAHEMIEQSGDLLFTPDDRATGAPEREADTAREGGRAANERWHMRKDGSRFYGSGSVTPLRDAAGRLLGFVKIMRDLTARQRAEEQLRASEERLRVLIESVQDYAIFTLDPQGRVTSWNEGAHRLTGYTAEEMVGRPMERLYTAEDVATAKPAQELETALRAGRSEDEGWRVRKDGARFWANAIVTPLVAGDGTHLGFTTISRDLTARKAAEDTVAHALAEAQTARAEAEAALATRAQFLSIASHELRTPLTSLLGYAHLLPRVAAQGTDALTPLAERITQQAQRLNRLIGQLLDVSRLERGQFALERTPLDLAALVGQVVDGFQARAELASPQRVMLHGADTPVWVLGDGPRLEQALLNLLSNAVKYSLPDGPVSVTLAVADGQAVLAVTDQGIGIPVEAQARLFEPFYRAPNAGAGTSGFGLGLYIVHEIVTRHGGQVVVDSTEGQGTTVRLVLPLQQER